MTHVFSTYREVARIDGRTDPVTVDRDIVRVAWTWPTHGSALRLEAASTRPRAQRGEFDVCDRAITHGSQPFASVPVPEGQLFWRLRPEQEVHTPFHRLWTTPALTDEATWITHPWWAAGSSAHTGSVWFASEFQHPAEATACLLHLATSGVATVEVNGQELPRRLAPGYSAYSKEIPAVSFNISEFVSPGSNRLTIELAAGMSWVSMDANRYSKLRHESIGLRMAALVESWGDDGRLATIASDSSWLTGRGASVSTHWYGGEDYDAAGADSLPDGLAAVALTFAEHKVWWPEHPPVLVTETLSPESVHHTNDSTSVVDFGVNIAGVPALSVGESAPLRARIRPAEILNQAGEVDQSSTGSPIFHTAVLNGREERWSPRFSFNGFRYVEITYAPNRPSGVKIEADVLRVSNRQVGTFHSGDRFVTTLHRLVERAVQGNMHSVFTDCPHREKLGWLEQLYLCFGALARNFDVEAHFRDAIRHIRRAQLASGAIPNIAPDFVDFTGIEYRGDPTAYREDPNWGAALVRGTLRHYVQYGDIRILEENLDAIKKFLSYLETREQHGLLDFGLGDWIALEERTSRSLVASHGYWQLLRDSARIFDAVSLRESASALHLKAEELRRILLSRFAPDPATSTQGELALLVDLNEDLSTARGVFDLLLARIEHDGARLTVGENCLPALIQAFSRFDSDSELYELVSRPDVPGYGYQVAVGMTALAETWTTISGAEGEGSQNHFMLGMIDDWLYDVIGGLRQADTSVGWQQAVIEPRMIPQVPNALTCFDSPRGTYSVRWERDREVEVEVPIGASAVIRLPPGWICLHEFAAALGNEEGSVFELTAGRFTFTAER